MPPTSLTEDPTILVAALAVLAGGPPSKDASTRRLADLLERGTLRPETWDKLVTAVRERGIGLPGVALGNLHSLGVEHHIMTFECLPSDRRRLRQQLLAEVSVATIWQCEGRGDLVAEVVADDENVVESVVQSYRPSVSLRVTHREETLVPALTEIVRRRRG
jgi:hypothetical protein